MVNLKKNTFKHVTINQSPDVEIEQTKLEWNGFKQYMYQKRKMHRNEMKIKISKCNNEDEKSAFLKEINNFGPRMLWRSVEDDNVVSSLHPNCRKLLFLLLLFPLSVACVERFFSKMKLVKTRLRNQLSQVTLENLLFIATESRKDGFDDKIYEYFVDELCCRNPKMRMDV